jgi:hypothetical protein
VIFFLKLVELFFSVKEVFMRLILGCLVLLQSGVWAITSWSTLAELFSDSDVVCSAPQVVIDPASSNAQVVWLGAEETSTL